MCIPTDLSLMTLNNTDVLIVMMDFTGIQRVELVLNARQIAENVQLMLVNHAMKI